jgi:hypothetical protein
MIKLYNNKKKKLTKKNKKPFDMEANTIFIQ